MDIDISILLAVTAFLLFLWVTTSKPKNFPPGPRRWPLIGSSTVVTKWISIPAYCTILFEKYGEVVGSYFFNKPLIIVSGLEGIREVCFRDDLTGRRENAYHRILYGKPQGIAQNSGEEWKLQRRFTLQHLRDLGFGKRTLEGVAYEEMQAVFDDIDEISGGINKGFPNAVNLHDVMGGASINVLWHILAGKRYEHKDPEFKRLIAAVKDSLQVTFEEKKLYTAVPWLAKIFPRLTGFSAVLSHYTPISEFLQEEIDGHKKTIDYENPRDFMDIYLTEIQKQKNYLHDVFNEQQLKVVYSELFVAGTDTTLNTLSFAILYMILYPETQIKVQQELDEVVGKDRFPSLTDRARLPYVEATINEVFRLSSIGPASLPRMPVTTDEYITFRGYHIPKVTGMIWTGQAYSQLAEMSAILGVPSMTPKGYQYIHQSVIHDVAWQQIVSAGKRKDDLALEAGEVDSDGIPMLTAVTDGSWGKRSYRTKYSLLFGVGAMIVCNLYGLHHDPKIWKSPEEFIPERFLHKDVKDLAREVLIPFGAGKRACLGQSLARNNVFLFFTGLLQRYSFRVPEGQPKPSKDPKGATLLFPKPYTVKVQLRN